jgi:hypothetical protein
MRNKNNIDDVKAYLSSDNNTARRFLGLLYIYRERESILKEDDSLDAVLGRLVQGLANRIRQREHSQTVYHATVRAKPIFNAWKARDKATVLQYLEDTAIRRGIFPTENEDLGSQRELLTMLRQVGGEAAASRVEERARRLSVVRVEDFERTVADTVERAFWDAAKEKVSQGDLGPLYDVLHNVRQCVSALLSAAPIAKGQWEDRFDAKWIQERGEAGNLGREDVGNLVMFLVDQIGRMQAPADDETVLPWVEATRTRAQETDALSDYLPEVVFVLRDALGYLRLVYRRMTVLSSKH